MKYLLLNPRFQLRTRRREHRLQTFIVGRVTTLCWDKDSKKSIPFRKFLPSQIYSKPERVSPSLGRPVDALNFSCTGFSIVFVDVIQSE